MLLRCLPGWLAVPLAVAAAVLSLVPSQATPAEGPALRATPDGVVEAPAAALNSSAVAQGERRLLQCPAGRYDLVGVCVRCVQGRYRLETGAEDRCELCPIARYRNTTGGTNVDDCARCPAGRTTEDEGSALFAQCKTCDAGEASIRAGDDCSPCAMGTIPTPDHDQCFACWEGRYSDSEGSSECQECPFGRFREFRGGSDVGDCTECNAGKFNNREGQQSQQACRECTAGSYSGFGSAACATCPRGKYSVRGSSDCQDCLPGRFQNMTGQGQCMNCERGKYRSMADEATFCRDCDAGKYGNESEAVSDESCQDCPLGTWAEQRGRTICDLCLEGAYCSTPGLSVCEVCPAGAPEGAVRCCPSHDESNWPVMPAGSLSTVPGKSTAAIWSLNYCGNGAVVDRQPLATVNWDPTRSIMNLATLDEGEIEECITVECGSDCRIRARSVLEEYDPGEGVEIKARVLSAIPLPFSAGFQYGHKTCEEPNSVAMVVISGFGCANDTLSYFIVCLTGIVVATVVLGLVLEAIQRARLKIFVESSVHIQLPAQALPSLPTVAMLHNTLVQGLGVSESQLPRELVSAYITSTTAHHGGFQLNLSYALASPRDTREIRRKLVQTSWTAASAIWKGIAVEPQLPTVVKARGKLPGMDLVEIVERALMVCCSCGAKTDEDLKELHLAIARSLLNNLISRCARTFLGAQYALNLVVAGGLAGLAYTQMTTCSAGYPTWIHGVWVCYILISGMFSFVVLWSLGGEKALTFISLFRYRLLLRYIFASIMLTDIYQDVTFPVIAKRCGFDLWFVSAWLVVLGIGVMQVMAQVVMLGYTVQRYRNSRTPEERDRHLVEGCFLALRGSDNLVLTYAVRPAVEERLGGSSSWAMKMTEARVAFFRFIFEDVEQSALQVVFLVFYESAATADKIWVSLSVLAGVLLSFTLVVQCLPEVRNWLWYRVLPWFPAARSFPVFRVPYLLCFLIIYRAISVFPWLSACSPSGDRCDSDKSLNIYIFGCNDDELFLLGLPVREEVLKEVLRTSAFCICGLGAAIILATMWSWLSDIITKQRSPRWKEFRTYNIERRFAESLEIRPLNDDDDDQWVHHARRLYKCIKEHGGENAEELLRLVERIDMTAFRLSRAPLPYRLPVCIRCPCCLRVGSQLQNLIDKLGTSAELGRMGDDATQSASRFCFEAAHAQQIAHVRWNTQRLLSTRKFLHASLMHKARCISEATGGFAPLRFLHWKQIEVLGYLPKCGEPNGAEEIDQVMMRCSETLGLNNSALGEMTPEWAERHVVPFFLSHRWLRTRGIKAHHHPDSEENIKAKTLVAFAKWFKTLAEDHGLKLEVLFWIDYCCTDQDDLSTMDLAIAALPLYVATCMKVVVWRTADFDRRCWTMVERLLAYSFCAGGLTPYVLDETFATEADEDLTQASDVRRYSRKEEPEPSPESIGAAASPAPPTTGDGIWQVFIGRWVEFIPKAQEELNAAVREGRKKLRLNLTQRDQAYDIDLEALVQRNVATGMERPIRLLPPDEEKFDGALPPGSVAPVPEKSKITNGSSRRKNPGSSVNIVHRRPRKLPNPLDFETCQVTRPSDRRRVAQLVDIALTVPALEVFADRQPVEWGLTEVIEQSLAVREPLPTRWRHQRDPPQSWLTPVLEARMDWHLVVEGGPGGAENKVVGRPNENMDAIVWVDETLPEPSMMGGPGMVPTATKGSGESAKFKPKPEQIDRCFKEVDRRMDSPEWSHADRDEAIRALIVLLKHDLQAAVASGSVEQMEQARIRTREVELPDKQRTIEHICGRRLQEALDSEDELNMRKALRQASTYGAEHLPLYSRVREAQQKLYKIDMTPKLQAQLEAAQKDGDLTSLCVVYETALKYQHQTIAETALESAKSTVPKAHVDSDIGVINAALQVTLDLKWRVLENFIQVIKEETELLKTLDIAVRRDDIGAVRAVEQKAQMTHRQQIQAQAGEHVKEMAARMGERMGLPPEWDVILDQAGLNAPGQKLLKRAEEREEALLQRVQSLLDETFTGWGPYGKSTRTRDRAKEKIASRLLIRSLVYVQNAESMLNYKVRRAVIAKQMKPGGPDYRIKTKLVSLEGVGKHGYGALDDRLNECYFWHGTSAFAAQKITEEQFDLKRAGSSYGTLFGSGIYFAESSMKADEYTNADKSTGWLPLILCRVTLGNIKYCDAAEPTKISKDLEAACQPGSEEGMHSVLGDREKVRGTFREFIVFDNHQVYPEYIVWYERIFG